MSQGKRGIAPCGHPGVYVIGQYVQCMSKCETTAASAPPVEHCPSCGDDDVDQEYELDAIFLMWNPGATRFSRRCWECGHLWVNS